MEIISEDASFFTSHIMCLPFINEAPSNFTALNSALQFTKLETAKINQKLAILTFDQPLFINTRSLVQENDKVLVRLGGFHLLMSYLGSIGYVMSGSGLEDMWAIVYAPESVKKMMTGHAFARSVRAHILTFTAIGMNIIDNAKPTEASRNHARKFFEKFNAEPPQIRDFNTDNFSMHLTEDFIRCIESLEKAGPTAKLWI